MIKNINHQNFLTTPFVAEKKWGLSNIDPQELVLTEDTGSEFSIALEFIDYTNGVPFVNTTCSIALEQQSSDLAIPEEGVSGSGTFFPASEETNQKTGTFKRSVYDQIEKAFYNDYRNPIQIFGLDNIDFPLGRTDRFLGNEFLMFTIPRKVFGERLSENTIVMSDPSFNDNIVIRDDGYGNLIAGYNLFSRVQEVRHFGNDIISGSIPDCIAYDWDDDINSWENEIAMWTGCETPVCNDPVWDEEVSEFDEQSIAWDGCPDA